MDTIALYTWVVHENYGNSIYINWQQRNVITLRTDAINYVSIEATTNVRTNIIIPIYQLQITSIGCDVGLTHADVPIIQSLPH